MANFSKKKTRYFESVDGANNLVQLFSNFCNWSCNSTAIFLIYPNKILL